MTVNQIKIMTKKRFASYKLFMSNKVVNKLASIVPKVRTIAKKIK
ncbi:hypothetical protein GCM10011607_41520 [Shewanella inventionis]|uniref:Uncharacterized protein n=1 Tax=Shewanella inventionis TaxID=1738770 RepID=A0ABQ1JW79_9GAMM|nr:hypothetical protein GCM10011607_41520 [Shewanella inventionis]